MSEIEIITGGGRRRRWSAAEKVRIVVETLYDSECISAVARRVGVGECWMEEASQRLATMM